MPLEVEAERARGRLPAERIAEIRHAAIDRRLGGGLHAVEHGGQGWSHTEWFLVEEQLGRCHQRAVVAHARRLQRPGPRHPGADRPLPQARAARRAARRLRRHRGARRAPTRRGSRPPPRASTGGWRIDGEKWFVTYGDVAHGLHRHGQGARRRRRAADAVPRRARHAGHRGRRRPALHAQLPPRPPDAALHRRRGRATTPSSAASAAARTCSAAGSPRSAWASRPAAWGRCGG